MVYRPVADDPQGPYDDDRPSTIPTKTLALVSLLLGIAWLGGVGSVVAIVTGIIALGLIGAGRASGKGMAIGGIVTGTATLGVTAVLLGSMFPGVTAPNNVGPLAESPPPLPVLDPNFPYPVYGSQDMVKYMAQSMIVHDDVIDLTAYGLATRSQAEDALLEAVIQNPYIVDVRTYGCEPRACRVGYGYSQAEQAAIQEQMLMISTNVLAEIIDPQMSDVDRVKAINKWIVDHTTYDKEAAALLPEDPTGFELPDEYRYAWNASGVLFHGKGVCEAYAEAFSLMANAAGVPTVIVSGTLTDGSPHAWNKVLVGGVWKAVDVTWNDGPPTTNAFLMINDSQFTAEASREEDDQWMTDDHIADYATP